MVDPSRDTQGRVRARLLDLVPGRSKKAYADWLAERGEAFRSGVRVAALDPFAGYKGAIDDQLDDAVAVVEAFHNVKLGTQALDEVRRRVQQQTLGRRGRKGDPLYGIQRSLRAGQENLTDRQADRVSSAVRADPAHEEVYLAWQCAQDLRAAYRATDLDEGRRLAEKVLATFHTCPVPEIARLGRTLRRWKNAFLAYFTTHRTNNGGTEAINGIIELHRRLARGYRNRENYGSECSWSSEVSHPNPHPRDVEPDMGLGNRTPSANAAPIRRKSHAATLSQHIHRPSYRGQARSGSRPCWSIRERPNSDLRCKGPHYIVIGELLCLRKLPCIVGLLDEELIPLI